MSILECLADMKCFLIPWIIVGAFVVVYIIAYFKLMDERKEDD